MYTNRKVLVTGGTGMIGRELVQMLLKRGAKVRVASLDDASRARPEIEFVRGNLLDWSFCKQMTQGMEFVFHVAGVKGSAGLGQSQVANFFVSNLLMNTLVMEAARLAGAERMLYTSSIGVYHPAEVFVEDRARDGPPPAADYYGAWAKRMGELQVETYKLGYGWDKIAVVRPANVYGPYDNFNPQTAMVVGALIGRVAAGEDPLVVWGDGSPIRDFIFARDCAEGMLLALEKGADCQPINLGSGMGVSIRQLVEVILGCSPSRRRSSGTPASRPARISVSWISICA